MLDRTAAFTGMSPREAGMAVFRGFLRILKYSSELGEVVNQFVIFHWTLSHFYDSINIVGETTTLQGRADHNAGGSSEITPFNVVYGDQTAVK